MPAMSSTMSTIWLMPTISLEPRLIGSVMSESKMASVPYRQSSMYMKLRVCSPSPHTSISCLPETCACATLRQIAAEVAPLVGD